jgi:hypothetical protein
MQRRFPNRPLSLLLGDFGHQRASNKANERARLVRAIRRWFDQHLRGAKRGPREGATAFLQSCPRDRRSPPPFTAPSFAALATSASRLHGAAAQTIVSGSGNPLVGVEIDPVTGGGDACALVDTAVAPGVATASRVVRPGRPITLIGAAEISATLTVDGARPDVSQIAARLWDVAPDGSSQLLVGRGTFRPTGDGPASWQLHPSAWRFKAGHTIKLELLGGDPPYARPSNGAFTITVGGLEVRLPTRPRR